MITPLVTGRGRPLQHELVAALRRAGFEIKSADLHELDDRRACRRVLARSRADIVFDCSGADDAGPESVTPTREQLAACESLAAAAADEGVHIVLVSSASVFGPQAAGPRLESDPPSPGTSRGAALLAAERAVARTNPDHTIVRSSRLYGCTWNSPFERLIARAQATQRLTVESRRISPPTYGPHLASVLVALVRNPCHGVIHRAAGGACGEAALARSVLRLAGVSCQVEPSGEDNEPDQGERPLFLASCRDELPVVPHWRIGLRACALEDGRLLRPDRLGAPGRTQRARD